MTNKRDARLLMDAVRDILNRVWAPIPESPPDECDGYIGGIAGLLMRGATDDEMLQYLARVEVCEMGLGEPFDLDRGVRVISALKVLRPSSN